MSENSEKITSTEGGQSRLLRSSDVMSMLEDIGALDTDFWAVDQILKSGRLYAERLWYEVDTLRKVSFEDGAVPIVDLQRQLAVLLENTLVYYQQNIDAEIDETNRFLLSRPNLFLTDQDSGRALQYLVTTPDQKGRAMIAVHYSNDREAPLTREELFIDTTMLSESEQKAVAAYQQEYSA